MVSRVIPVRPFDLVIFGATGDLARRKILPGLFHRFVVGQMPPEARVVGAARSDMDASTFRDQIRESLIEFAPRAKEQADLLEDFLTRLDYVSVDAAGEKGWKELAGLMREDTIRAFYLSVTPSLFGAISQSLHTHGIATAESRIVV